jgi:hypothetical protein
MAEATYPGYAFEYLLRASPVGSGSTHWQLGVSDLVWLDRLPRVETTRFWFAVWDDAEYNIGPRYRAPTTLCGIAGPLEPGVPGDEHCNACMEWVDSAVAAAVVDAVAEILAARWRERWPDYPRSLALADWQD